MSGRQPRLFAMNRYSVIQSVFKPKEKEKLLALEVSQEDIDNPDKEKELRKKLEPPPRRGLCSDDDVCCGPRGPICTFWGCITKCGPQ